MFQFEPYRGRRTYEDIADQIKDAILRKYFRDGDQLPPERELAEQFQVGRVSIREALRKLETLGILEIRKGSKGGAFVKTGNMEHMASMIMDRLQLEGTTHDMMIEARIGIECAVIPSAVAHATPDDLERIAKDIEESKEPLGPELSQKVVARMISFHLLLAEASHNVPYIMFMHSMMEWAARKLAEWVPTEEEQLYSYNSHKEIYEVILRRDVSGAQRLMRGHIEKMGRFVLRRQKPADSGERAESVPPQETYSF